MAKLGTFQLGTNSVTLTRGRGKNRSVVLDVSFRQLEVWAIRNRIDEKKLFAKMYGRACFGLRNKLRQVMTNQGGVNGVPKFRSFESFTNELRAAEGISTPMGGRLADPRRIVAYKRGNKQIIGWPDSMMKLAIAFQDGTGGDGYKDKSLRRYWYSLGIDYIPPEYAHNPRRILPEPFSSYCLKHLEEWARGSFYKELAKQMAKKRLGG